MGRGILERVGAPPVSAAGEREPSVLPYPDDRGRTHWEGCWREPGHHNCAVREIERLRAALAERPDLADRIAALLAPRIP